MKPYAELLEFNQPNLLRKEGFTRIRDQFRELAERKWEGSGPAGGALGPVAYKVEDFYDVVCDPERITEFAGRWDYGPKNADKLGQPSKTGEPIIQGWINSGEQSMLEMGHATFFVECSRNVANQFIRHRIASYQQESQRYTKYDDMEPWEFFYNPATEDDILEGSAIQRHYEESLKLYKYLRSEGMSPQDARYVLPGGTRTRMVVSANVREWRHIIKLRLHSSAQPEMRELMQQIYDQLVEVFPQSLSGVLEEGRGVR